ncbi:MAG: hypothetical protein K0R24_156 [Gammaproteobacteria bacterium]|jgi:hypothetical protein|nr:hypothetical protein [Gammaproteobacteria bacterium]
MSDQTFITKRTITRKWVCQKNSLNESVAKILDGLNDKSYHDASLFSVKAVLKQDKKTELILIDCNGTLLVIKHYRMPDLAYHIRRLFFESRAARNWKNAQRLVQWGIATPVPVAYIERRFFFLRRESFYITEYIQGQCLCEALPHCSEEIQTILAEKVINFLKILHQKGFVHGDMKCTNMIVIKKEIFFLDLDSMRHVIFRRRYKINGDYNRFLKNWLTKPHLFSTFEKAFFPDRNNALIGKNK